MEHSEILMENDMEGASPDTMLGGATDTTAGHVFRLQIEGTASSYGG
jgi:hypothetical protein